MAPTPNGGNGRTAGGRFAPGNPGGPGNPYAQRVAQLRGLMLDAVTEDDLRVIVAAVVDKAKAGDLAAAGFVLDRVLGKPLPALDPDRVDIDGAQLAQLRSLRSLRVW